MPEPTIEGGCYCGEVRYRATKRPTGSGICFCPNCRGATASVAPFYTKFTTDNCETDEFRFLASGPFRYRYDGGLYSDSLGRVLWSETWFCGACGTPIAHIHEGLTDGSEQERVEAVSVMVATLDDPSVVPQPTSLEWEEDMLPLTQLWSVGDGQLCVAILNVSSDMPPSRIVVAQE
ncbi:hypothetical protein CMK11_13520 [Candidatus Poribacteria bacterium]|nr:hypothetical protein [Candidatus Poribacteria bacterium]